MKIKLKGKVLCTLDDQLNIVTCKDEDFRELVDVYKTRGMTFVGAGDDKSKRKTLTDGEYTVKLTPDTVRSFEQKLMELGYTLER